MKLKLILTKGIPGSGKSTWAKKWVEEDPINRIRVNRDDLRRMFGPYWIPEREDFTSIVENSIIQEALENGKSVVVDATNLKYPNRWKTLAAITNAEYLFQDFTDVPLELCIERDKSREHQVGEEVIRNFYKKYIQK